ncbi:MAG: serine/arginine repetitive matrix protein 2 [Eubacterium sp.]|nr:serine/arginine repetitive matrix protein 2 [Eubacterium sp.]
MGRKLTRHNGRSGKNGVFNVKHNDRRFDVTNSEHIDAGRTKDNLYWDCYGGLYRMGDQEDHPSFAEIEKQFYDERYRDFTQNQNARNEARRHPEKNRTPEHLRADKRTCPEETIYQMGTMGDSESPETLCTIATEFFAEFDARFGDHVHILDWALHLDEGTPHIQERHVFDCENKYGETAPQQEKALELLDIPLPDPEKPKGKYNNRKMTFDNICRTMLFDICKSHGVYLEEEPTYGGRAYLEKQDYIRMKQKEEIEKQDRVIHEQTVIIEKREDRLEELTMRIADAETLIDEVADAAYEKAAEEIAVMVQAETHRQDLHVLAEYQKWLLSPERKAPIAQREFAAKHLGSVMDRIRNSVRKVKDRIFSLLRDPMKKAEILAPVKEQGRQSVLAFLKKAKEESAARNTARREVKKLPEKEKTGHVNVRI